MSLLFHFLYYRVQSILYNRVNMLSSNMLLFFQNSTITLLVMLSAVFPMWQDCVGVPSMSNSWCPLLEYFSWTLTIAASTTQLQEILMVEVLILINIINTNRKKIPHREIYCFCLVVIEYSDSTSANPFLFKWCLCWFFFFPLQILWHWSAL